MRVEVTFVAGTYDVHPDNQLLADIEHRRLWSHFHKDWLLALRSSIRTQLPARYKVFVESEVVVIAPGTAEEGLPLAPDVGVIRPAAAPPRLQRAHGDATAAVIEVDEVVELYTSYSLVIRRAPERLLVAALELLSPTNKGVFGQLDKDKFLRKRALYMEAGVNLLEIDALLGGDRLHPSAIAGLAAHLRTAWSVSHDQGMRRYRGWAWDADDPPPRIAWEVEPGLNVLLDLAIALREARQFNTWDDLENS